MGDTVQLETEDGLVEQEECVGREDVAEQDDSDVRWKDKKYIVLSSRVHPGESNSSWVMRGMYYQPATTICGAVYRCFTVLAHLPIRRG